MARTERKFTAAGLTHSATHHLLAVGEAIEQRGYARVSDIARSLGLTRGSVSVAMRSLKSAGYVEQDDNRFFVLTDKGRQAIASVLARHEVVEQFLTEVLALPAEQSHRESCRMEYLIEAPTARRLFALVEFWRSSNLAGTFEEGLGPLCPVCKGQDVESCPCCGLECLDDSCSLAAEKK